jgi:hypothetical protein
MSSLLPRVTHALVEGGGNAAQRVDLVIIGLLGLLLLEYDLLRAYLGGSTLNRLRPFGIAIVPLLIVCAIVIAHRWRELSR